MSFDRLLESLANKTFPLEWSGHWIGGEWTTCDDATTQKTSLNPSTGEPLVSFAESKSIVSRAIDAASAAEKSLADLSKQQRMEILRSLAQAFADYNQDFQRCLQVEIGKPAWEAKGDLDAAIRYLRWVADNGDQVYQQLLGPAKIYHRGGDFKLLPLGTTAAYLPFSTPITSFVFYFTAAVLAGCPLILFSSTHAAICSMLFAYCGEKLELPKGLLNIVFGGYQNFSQSMSDKRVAAVLYTGSREHCEQIRRDSSKRPSRQLVLQSGGKNSALVHSSADLDLAVRNIVMGMCKSGGQLCSSTSRAFVYRNLLPEFKEKLTHALESIVIGRTDDYEDPVGPHLGPIFSRKAIEKFLRFQTMANREAEENIKWGKTFDSGSQGFFISPGAHVMKSYDNSSAYQSNVIFSPDLAIYPYDVLDDAIEQINDCDAVFAVSYFGDPQIIEQRRNQFVAPNLLINLPTVEVETTLPLAGRFASGQTRFQGPALTLYLCYPQVVQEDDKSKEIVASWPWIEE